MDFNEARDTFTRLDSAIEIAAQEKERLDNELFKYFCENRPQVRHRKSRKVYNVIGDYGRQGPRGVSVVVIREENETSGFRHFSPREIIENFEILS